MQLYLYHFTPLHYTRKSSHSPFYPFQTVITHSQRCSVSESTKLPAIHLPHHLMLLTVDKQRRIMRRSLRLRFDCNSTALRPFDDIRYDHWHRGLNKRVSASTGIDVLRRCDFSRTAVESQSIGESPRAPDKVVYDVIPRTARSTVDVPPAGRAHERVGPASSDKRPFNRAHVLLVVIHGRPPPPPLALDSRTAGDLRRRLTTIQARCYLTRRSFSTDRRRRQRLVPVRIRFLRQPQRCTSVTNVIIINIIDLYSAYYSG